MILEIKDPRKGWRWEVTYFAVTDLDQEAIRFYKNLGNICKWCHATMGTNYAYTNGKLIKGKWLYVNSLLKFFFMEKEDAVQFAMTWG